jgi:hypothetical protein
MFAVSEPSVLWKAIWQALDISIVNKNFYRDIKAAFDSLIAALSNCKGILTRPEQRAQFAVRLLEESLIAYLSGDTNVQPIFMTSPSKSLSSPSNQVSSPNDSIGDPALKSGFPITPSGMTGNGGDADKGACHAPLQKSISDFVHTAEITANLKPHAATLLEKLNRLKTIDIAAGSGAFPIGMLQKIVMLKQALNPKASPYDLKLETIENSIYGVDIQPVAIELSRLRCWLSLIVDEEPDKVQPLPNLDFKFVCADSLIDLGYKAFREQCEKKHGLLFLGDFEQKMTELKKIRHDYFDSAHNHGDKQQLKKKFLAIQDEILKLYYHVNGFSAAGRPSVIMPVLPAFLR